MFYKIKITANKNDNDNKRQINKTFFWHVAFFPLSEVFVVFNFLF